MERRLRAPAFILPLEGSRAKQTVASMPNAPLELETQFGEEPDGGIHVFHHGSGRMGALVHLGGLDESEDVAIRVPDVELLPVRHDAERHRDTRPRPGEL